jgi:hypothetical protein
MIGDVVEPTRPVLQHLYIDIYISYSMRAYSTLFARENLKRPLPGMEGDKLQTGLALGEPKLEIADLRDTVIKVDITTPWQPWYSRLVGCIRTKSTGFGAFTISLANDLGQAIQRRC